MQIIAHLFSLHVGEDFIKLELSLLCAAPVKRLSVRAAMVTGDNPISFSPLTESHRSLDTTTLVFPAQKQLAGGQSG